MSLMVLVSQVAGKSEMDNRIRMLIFCDQQ